MTEQTKAIVIISVCELCGTLTQCAHVQDPAGREWILCEDCNPEMPL